MKNKKLLIVSSIFVILIALLTSTYVLLLENSYKAIGIEEYYNSNKEVKVTFENNGLYFDGNGTDTLLIFYPGALVEYDAYTRLMFKLAENGIDTFLIDLPVNIAFFGKNKPNSIIKELDQYNTYYVGGHSLGGVVATSYANSHIDKISGIVLLASYPNEKVDNKLNLISIYGDKDGVLALKKYKKAKDNWPTNSYELVIKGGNHAGFGNYGNQKGDNEATITNEEQQDEAIKFIIENIK